MQAETISMIIRHAARFPELLLDLYEIAATHGGLIVTIASIMAIGACFLMIYRLLMALCAITRIIWNPMITFLTTGMIVCVAIFIAYYNSISDAAVHSVIKTGTIDSTSAEAVRSHLAVAKINELFRFLVDAARGIDFKNASAVVVDFIQRAPPVT